MNINKEQFKMYRLYGLLMLICCISITINAQELIDTCGTVLLPEQLEYMEETREARNNFSMGIFDETPLIPLAIHIIRSSAGEGGLSEETLNAAIDNLNNAFVQKKETTDPEAVPIFTFEACFINYIDDDYYFNNKLSSGLSKCSSEYQLAEPNLVNGYLNIFFLPDIAACGWASFPGYLNLSGKYAPKDWIVMNNKCSDPRQSVKKLASI